MNTTPTDQPADHPAIDLTALPGRLVDAVHLAAQRAGLRINTFNVMSFQRVEVTAYLAVDGPRDVHAARTVFAQLGVTKVTIAASPGGNHATVTAPVPVLDDVTVVLIIDPIPADPSSVDPAGLLAEVDTHRAHTATVEPTPAPQRKTRPTRATTRPRLGAHRFAAESDLICPACNEVLKEGAPASWLRRGVVVHDTCAEAAGIWVYDPR